MLTVFIIIANWVTKVYPPHYIHKSQSAGHVKKPFAQLKKTVTQLQGSLPSTW
jgi:hypothetical protein